MIFALAAAVLLAVSLPSSASAAEGVLTVNGSGYDDPSGCYPVDSLPGSIANRTDAIAEVHTGAECSGSVEWLVYPGETYQSETAKSVFVL
ncbi:hypothetical protein OHB35_00645 [Streptomyces phaeochromogenes]|uniref:Uncharacterized protein n=1 Tax=Streptomyces phaeochromogenes TaxID=1923 RepID=A0ABZ1H109_STRPH|nr:hypothetical protein [Streptomyces phaeochromogenes]WSD11840.1 hypothetical protein OHB35_00645 [Streptomyces phaeochromogenes]